VIGGNVWLTQAVPAGAHVRQAHPSLTIVERERTEQPLLDRAGSV